MAHSTKTINIGENDLILQNIDTKERYPLFENMTMGRVGCDVNFGNDRTISSKHVKFVFKHDQWHLEDLNSKNGTEVNGKEIPPNKEIPLDIGDKLIVGHVQLEVIKAKALRDEHKENAQETKAKIQIEETEESSEKEPYFDDEAKNADHIGKSEDPQKKEGKTDEENTNVKNDNEEDNKGSKEDVEKDEVEDEEEDEEDKGDSKEKFQKNYNLYKESFKSSLKEFYLIKNWNKKTLLILGLISLSLLLDAPIYPWWKKENMLYQLDGFLVGSIISKLLAIVFIFYFHYSAHKAKPLPGKKVLLLFFIDFLLLEAVYLNFLDVLAPSNYELKIKANRMFYFCVKVGDVNKCKQSKIPEVMDFLDDKAKNKLNMIIDKNSSGSNELDKLIQPNKPVKSPKK